MKEDEKMFFRICVKYRTRRLRYITIRDIVNILHECGFMHYKRAWGLLEKWCGLGFYDFGVSLDLGWFDLSKLPERYAELLVESEVQP